MLGALLIAMQVAAAPATSVAQQDVDQSETETEGQLWVTFQVFKPLGPRQLVLHAEARSNGGGDDGFASIDVRGRTNFYPLSWLDVFPEVLARYTKENADVNSTMISVRGGARFQLPTTQEIFDRERVPLERLHLAALLRLEWRHFFYSGGGKDDSWRARARLEARFPLNHGSLSADETVYLRGDAEAFVPLGSESPETFASRWRFRAGLGYRFSFPWRIEVLGIAQNSRDTIEDDFTRTELMLNLRLRHYF